MALQAVTAQRLLHTNLLLLGFLPEACEVCGWLVWITCVCVCCGWHDGVAAHEKLNTRHHFLRVSKSCNVV